MKKIFFCVISALISVSLFAGCGSTGNGADETKQAEQSVSSAEELALTAYDSFLSGNRTLLNDAQSDTWWIPDFQDEDMAYEYTCLDLDGDGVSELLIQMADDPSGYNGVFHFESGGIFCWNSDGAEGSCRDYPLNDGTMVRQYDENGTCTYTVFRYQADGDKVDISSLFMREELIPEDSTEPCPCYQIDSEEVGKAEFDKQRDALVTAKMLERSAWTAI